MPNPFVTANTITAASSAVNHSKETGSGDKSLGFPYLQEVLLALLVLQLQDLLYCPEMDRRVETVHIPIQYKQAAEHHRRKSKECISKHLKTPKDEILKH